MKVGVAREQASGERRVSITPAGVARLLTEGHEVLVERAAGLGAGFSDASYGAEGASIAENWENLCDQSQMLLVIHPPDNPNPIRPGTILIGMLNLWSRSEIAQQWLVNNHITAFALDAMPRISRAQNMDVLSSMSTVAGYRAVILAAELLERFFPMLMTAAGTIIPARVLVLGAGVAGLQAIATAHRLGAIVKAFDTRSTVKEQVESLGASFLNLEISEAGTSDGYASGLDEDQHHRELEFLTPFVREADVVITTAQIPGREAPLLITTEMVEGMKPGSVIIDLAGETGGNCELSQPGSLTQSHGVKISAPLDLVSQMAVDASFLYSRNLVNFILYLTGLGLEPLQTRDFPDEIYQRTCLTIPATRSSTVPTTP